MLPKYKLSSGVLNEPNPKDIEILVSLNKTIDTLFREVTFKMDVDFELYIKLWYYENGWKNYEGKLQKGSNNYNKVRSDQFARKPITLKYAFVKKGTPSDICLPYFLK